MVSSDIAVLDRCIDVGINCGDDSFRETLHFLLAVLVVWLLRGLLLRVVR